MTNEVFVFFMQNKIEVVDIEFQRVEEIKSLLKKFDEVTRNSQVL